MLNVLQHTHTQMGTFKDLNLEFLTCGWGVEPYYYSCVDKYIVNKTACTNALTHYKGFKLLTPKKNF